MSDSRPKPFRPYAIDADRNLITLRHRLDCSKVSREEARNIGQKVYWPDKACRRGHHSWRFVSNGICLLCNRINGKSYVRRSYITEDDLADGEARRRVELLEDDRRLREQIRDPLYDGGDDHE